MTKRSCLRRIDHMWRYFFFPVKASAIQSVATTQQMHSKTPSPLIVVVLEPVKEASASQDSRDSHLLGVLGLLPRERDWDNDSPTASFSRHVPCAYHSSEEPFLYIHVKSCKDCLSTMTCKEVSGTSTTHFFRRSI